ncbi:hypothetical protein OIU77_022012 [Salix suchowensis]|uniref:Uncharacterized protein n=1 Tax=Salix suchowensis TaxID=1278906 RepID=A0ABQ9CBY2_9ROSI|nr:hypothetical protein OIU77_022012 [Salix suchowensis]
MQHAKSQSWASPPPGSKWQHLHLALRSGHVDADTITIYEPLGPKYTRILPQIRILIHPFNVELNIHIARNLVPTKLRLLRRGV